jgi:cellulose biosynthesis protein BcsQ
VIVFSLYNIKGGVGKTAAAVNLAYLSARDGARTLLCDLDPQSSSTFYLRVKPKVKAGSKLIVMGAKKLENSIKGTDFENLDLLPADFSFRNFDLVLDDAKKSKKVLKQFLEPLADQYDHIFLDCPPNLTLLSENVLHASDMLISPVIPTVLSQRTHKQLLKFMDETEIKRPPAVLPFFSMVDKRKKMHVDLCEELRDQFPQFLDATIANLSDVEKMGIHRKPVHEFSHGLARRAYFTLWQEIKQRTRDYGFKLVDDRTAPRWI